MADEAERANRRDAQIHTVWTLFGEREHAKAVAVIRDGRERADAHRAFVDGLTGRDRRADDAALRAEPVGFGAVVAHATVRHLQAEEARDGARRGGQHVAE